MIEMETSVFMFVHTLAKEISDIFYPFHTNVGLILPQNLAHFVLYNIAYKVPGNFFLQYIKHPKLKA